MQHIVLIVFVSVFLLVSSISVGRVSNARLLPGLINQSVWLFNQANANTCLCRALNLYSLQQIAGLNSFSSNNSCQLILSTPVLSSTIISDTKSSLLLLQLFSDVPCCSDLSWLLARIQNSQQPSVSVLTPTALSINSANMLLSTLTYRGPLVRFHRNNLSLAGSYSLPVDYVCGTSSYHQGRFFVGCNTPAGVVVFNETNMTSPAYIVNTATKTRAVSFARNDTVMFAATQLIPTSVTVYNIILPANTYIPLNNAYLPTYSVPWALNTINDSFVLMTNWASGFPVYALKSPSKTNNTWSMVPLNATKGNSSSATADAIIDSCGRLWVVVYGFGIQIYDQTATVLLANWTVSTGLGNILLLNTYELFLSDYDHNLILHFNPNLQCTS